MPHSKHIFRDILKGSSIAFLFRASGGIFQLILTLVAAKILGPTEAGQYFLVLAIANISMTIGRMGAPGAIISMIPAYCEHNQPSRAKGVFNMSLIVCALVSFYIAMLISLDSTQIAYKLLNQERIAGLLSLISLAIPWMAICYVYAAFFSAIRKIAYSQLIENFLLPVLSLIFFFAWGRHYGARGLAWCTIAAAASSAMCAMFLLSRCDTDIQKSEPEYEWKRFFEYSMPTLIISLMQVATNWAPNLLLGYYTSPAEVAQYHVVSRLALAFSLIAQSLTSSADSQFSRLNARGEHDILEKIGRNTTVLGAIISMPIAIIFLAFPERILNLIGNHYDNAVSALIIVTLGYVAYVTAGVAARILIVSGHMKPARNISLISTSIFFALCILLIPRYGIVGAAIAHAASNVFSSAISSWMLFRKLGITIFLFAS